MYTSDIKITRNLYIAATIFVVVFALIYEYFSHGVYSIHMLGAFAFPMAGGLLTEFLYRHANKINRGLGLAPQLLAGSVIWFTLGSIYEGVLEIYGTTNKLVTIYLLVGLVQLAAALVVLLFPHKN